MVMWLVAGSDKVLEWVALQRIVFAVGGGWGRWYLIGSLCRYSLWGPQGAAVLRTDTSGWQAVVVRSGT